MVEKRDLLKSVQQQGRAVEEHEAVTSEEIEQLLESMSELECNLENDINKHEDNRSKWVLSMSEITKKSKKIDKKKDTVYIDIEDKDPVWLKDKGDHFYKRNDYYSALNAYTKSLEFDKEFVMARLNRATTWIKTRCFENGIEDLLEI